MSMSTAQDSAAFPVADTDSMRSPGLTAREHAAIALRVPDSGNDWLDAMIRTAQRNDLAKAAMQAAATNPTGADGFTFEQRAEWSYQQADAMLSGAQIAEGE